MLNLFASTIRNKTSYVVLFVLFTRLYRKAFYVVVTICMLMKCVQTHILHCIWQFIYGASFCHYAAYSVEG